MNTKKLSIGIWLAYLFFNIGCQQSAVKNTGDETTPVLAPEEELKSFALEQDLEIRLVASEPLVQDPVVIQFDEQGRIWVVEMRGFMPDIDGKGEKDRVGRINILLDRDGDGMMDSSIVYLDSLVLPRALALVADGALVVENAALWWTRDLDHDLHADSKVLIDSTYAGNMLPEHSGNGLWRGLDNWYYNAKSRLRYKLEDGHWVRDSTEFRGQWGISHDDEGRLYYNYNWSQLHADLVPPNYFSRNKNHLTTTGIDHGLTLDRRVYPIRENIAVNRGYIPGTLDENNRLLEFTAACSPLYYRGAAMPAAYYGNVFVCEPSGNLVKRNVIEKHGYMVSARDPHPGREFLASTDERFRPVYLSNSPDGAMYIVDMYRGLIQHGAYVTPYLREQTVKRKMVLPIHCGRIWKVVGKTSQTGQKIDLSTASNQALVPYLSHREGWYRDLAQRLLVERKAEDIGAQLLDSIMRGRNTIGRIHALWTAKDLGLLKANDLIVLSSDTEEAIRSTAIRLLEHFAENNGVVKSQLAVALERNSKKAGDKELLQIALSAGAVDFNRASTTLLFILNRQDTSALMRDAILSSLYKNEYSFLKNLQQSPWWGQSTPAKQVFLEMLATAVLKNGDGAEMNNLLANLSSADDQQWQSKTILTALSIQGRSNAFKPIKLSKAPPVLNAANLLDDQRMKILNQMFEWPGHIPDKKTTQSSAITGEIDQKQFSLGRQFFLTTCAGCHGSDGAGVTRFAPTLIGSDWVLGDPKRLALLILHGIEGPIEVNEKKYDVPDILPVMPAHSVMDDGQITAIMNYIRNEWGNAAEPVSNRVVGGARHLTQGRVMPWTAIELNQRIQKDLQTNPPK